MKGILILCIYAAVMLLLLIAGIAIANIPGLTVTHLFLFYGTMRASTLLPTVLTLKGVQLSPNGITKGIVAALTVSTDGPLREKSL